MVMTRIQQWQRLLPALVGLLILVAIGLLPVSLPMEDDTTTQAISESAGVNATPQRPIGGVFAGITVAQEFPAAATKISRAALVLATYERTNSGTIQVMLQTQTNGRWQTLGSRAVEKAALRDNEPNTVTFDPPLVVKRGDIVRIVLQADGNAQNAISWWINPSDQRPGFALFLNGAPLPGTAQFQVSYARASGRLVEMIGPIWTRITVFLSPLWRVILAVGILILLSSLFVLGRYLPGKAPTFSQPLSPRPVLEMEEETFSHSPSFVWKEAGECDEEDQSMEGIRPDPASQGVDR
jgi:hypothetical protein